MPYEHKDELSKSELKRLCVLKPLEMADRIHRLETQLADANRIIAASFIFPSAWIDANGFPHHLSDYQSATELGLQRNPWEPLYRKPK